MKQIGLWLLVMSSVIAGELSYQDLRFAYHHFTYEDLNEDTYHQIQGDRETEHQVGRFINFKNIISQCKELEGDFIEFGTCTGFGLSWIAFLAEQQELYSKHIVGVDGFVGIPYEEDGFAVGNFEISLEQCSDNIAGNKEYSFREICFFSKQ